MDSDPEPTGDLRAGLGTTNKGEGSPVTSYEAVDLGTVQIACMISAFIAVKIFVKRPGKVPKRPNGRDSIDPANIAKLRINIRGNYPDWRAGSDGRIPCPPKKYGGCRHPSLKLKRIFKMNWVAKLAKNVDEMVSGCRLDTSNCRKAAGSDASILARCSITEGRDSSSLYDSIAGNITAVDISEFLMHWRMGEPIIFKGVWDKSLSSSWDPLVIWRGIMETDDEKMKAENRKVKVTDCLNKSEDSINTSDNAASFADLWVPFCRKQNIETKNPEAYFSMKSDPTKNKSRSDFAKDRRKMKMEYGEFKVRINALPDSIRRRSDAFNVREEMKMMKYMRENDGDPFEKVMLKPPSYGPLMGNTEDKLIDFTDMDICGGLFHLTSPKA